MCGICGCFSLNGDLSLGQTELERMVGTLRHRGPDDQGVHITPTCGLGHSRLSIIDLEGGHQPLFNEERTVALICNGEIYNYRELRADLIDAGHRFATDSDCEVIVHLWEEHGPACVEHLRGMFAFALFDQKRNALFLARDRFGQKPLFIHHGGGRLSFASEIKALLTLPHVSRELDPVALDQFLFYQFVPHPRTMFRGIRQLPPGHWLLAEHGGVRQERYWSWTLNPDNNRPHIEHLAEVRAALDDAVTSHLVSDVEVGLFLSGGIDSSLIAALAAQGAGHTLRSFSIGFPGERQDESTFARQAAAHLGLEHREFPFAPGDVMQRLEELAGRFDQPLADRAAIPLMMLAEETAKEVKVVLTGDGGDELFAGYEKHRRTRRPAVLMRLARSLWTAGYESSILAQCRPDALGTRKLRARLAFRHLPEQESSYFKSYWEGWDRHRLFAADLRNELGAAFKALDERVGASETPTDTLNRVLLIDSRGYLPDDLLLKTDYATMAHGLEARAPLLDHRLAAVAGRLPLDLKATHSETKVALRRIAADLLPWDLVARRKQGFAVPMESWLRGDLRDWTRDRLLGPEASTRHLFEADTIRGVLDEHASGRRNHTSRIYSLLFFELWHRHHLA